MGRLQTPDFGAFKALRSAFREAPSKALENAIFKSRRQARSNGLVLHPYGQADKLDEIASRNTNQALHSGVERGCY